MKNYYKRYIKPVLAELSPDAIQELAYDKIFTEYVETMRNPLFWLFQRKNPESMTNYVYWVILGLYARTKLVQANVYQNKNFRAVVKKDDKIRAQVKKAYQDASQLPMRLTKTRFQNMQFLVTNARLEKLGTRATHR